MHTLSDERTLGDDHLFTFFTRFVEEARIDFTADTSARVNTNNRSSGKQGHAVAEAARLTQRLEELIQGSGSTSA